MKKRFIPIISVIMTISLIVFISVQIYWLKQAVEAGEQDFSDRAQEALVKSSEKINQLEIDKFYKTYNNFYSNTNSQKDSSEIQTAMSVIDSAAVKYIIYKKTIVNSKPLVIPYNKQDTLKITNLLTEEGVLKVDKDPNENNFTPITPNIENTINSPSFTLNQFAKLSINQTDVSKRTNIKVLDSVVKSELIKSDIEIPFQIGVTDSLNNLKIKSYNFGDIGTIKNKYTTNLYMDSQGKSLYNLNVYFPDKEFSLISPMIRAIILTLLSTLIILTIYVVCITYMYRQKKVSEIKTDFINNMSHELKTPIASIAIASDAIKSPKVKGNTEKIDFYASLIKQENIRMKNQIDMILTMSQLEKSNLNIHKDTININTVLKQSIQAVRLQVEERNGTIVEEFNNTIQEISGDALHLTNIFINVLDNANKYSPDKPYIKLVVSNTDTDITISISDKGKGIPNKVLNKIFDKFYREETGNIHNVKGHGLGLSYVKKIVKLHKGEINVHSKSEIGTTFDITLPIG